MADHFPIVGLFDDRVLPESGRHGDEAERSEKLVGSLEHFPRRVSLSVGNKNGLRESKQSTDINITHLVTEAKLGYVLYHHWLIMVTNRANSDKPVLSFVRWRRLMFCRGMEQLASKRYPKSGPTCYLYNEGIQWNDFKQKNSMSSVRFD